MHVAQTLTSPPLCVLVDTSGLNVRAPELQVDMSHYGVFLFKGLSEPSSIVQISRRRWAGRSFPPLQLHKKAKLVQPGRGHLYSFSLPLTDG